MKTTSWLLKTVSVLLTIAWYFNIILLVVAFGFLTLKFTTSDTVEFSNPVKYTNAQAPVKLSPRTTDVEKIVLNPDQATLKMELKNTPGYVAMAYFFLISLEFLIMTIIYQLRKFFNSIGQNIPFKYDNIKRLRTTALCFILLTPLHILLGVSTAVVLKGNVKDFELTNMVWEESFTGVFLGMAIYIIADIFKYGFELQKENGEFV